MKTTEIFVEQVLIGAMVLIVIALFLGYGVEDLSPKDNAGAAAMAVFGLGAAYLAGIVYDRVNDTMLEAIERRSRLRAVAGFPKYGRRYDPLPEDQLRLRIQIADKAVAEYADYLRTRIRLTRALATLAPVFALAVLVGNPALCPAQGHACPHAALIGALSSVLVYGVVFGLAIVREPPDALKRYWKSQMPGDKSAPNESRWRTYVCRPVPRTYHLIGPELDAYLDNFRPAYEPAYWALGVVTVGGCVINGTACSVAIMSGGAVVALLAGWTWLRIAQTYRGLLVTFKDVSRDVTTK